VGAQQGPAGQLSKRWRIRMEPNGTVRMRRVNRPGEVLSQLVGTFFLTGLTSLGIAACLGVKIAGKAPEPTSPGAVALALLFGLASLLAIGYAIFTLFGRVEWFVRPNLLEIRRELFGYRWVRRYTDATLALTWQPDHEGQRLALSLEIAGRHPTVVTSTPDCQELIAFLAQHTGWPIKQPATWRLPPQVQEWLEKYVPPFPGTPAAPQAGSSSGEAAAPRGLWRRPLLAGIGGFLFATLLGVGVEMLALLLFARLRSPDPQPVRETSDLFAALSILALVGLALLVFALAGGISVGILTAAHASRTGRFPLHARIGYVLLALVCIWAGIRSVQAQRQRTAGAGVLPAESAHVPSAVDVDRLPRHVAVAGEHDGDRRHFLHRAEAADGDQVRPRVGIDAHHFRLHQRG
jgi:hypothetical protein